MIMLWRNSLFMRIVVSRFEGRHALARPLDVIPAREVMEALTMA